MKRRWNLSDLNEWHVAAANLRGLTLAEAEARIREMIEALQEEELRNIGADPADFAAVERVRTEHVRLREQAIENWRALVALHNAENDSGWVQ
jgi:predicted RNase H-like HicB family nuclease